MSWKLCLRNYKVTGTRNVQFKKCVVFNSFIWEKKYVVHYLVEIEANIVSPEHIRHMENINCHRILVGTVEIRL